MFIHSGEPTVSIYFWFIFVDLFHKFTVNLDANFCFPTVVCEPFLVQSVCFANCFRLLAVDLGVDTLTQHVETLIATFLLISFSDFLWTGQRCICSSYQSLSVYRLIFVVCFVYDWNTLICCFCCLCCLWFL